VAAPTTLIYQYVEDVLELRAPHRQEHLAHIARWSADGRLAMAGALGDPPSGALFLFEVESPDEVEDFVDQDPYVAADLVLRHVIEPWTLVAHRPLQNPTP